MSEVRSWVKHEKLLRHFARHCPNFAEGRVKSAKFGLNFPLHSSLSRPQFRKGATYNFIKPEKSSTASMIHVYVPHKLGVVWFTRL